MKKLFMHASLSLHVARFAQVLFTLHVLKYMHAHFSAAQQGHPKDSKRATPQVS